jgi:predicted transcriptional regulator
MDNLFRKGWLNRQKSGRAYWYVTVRSREDYVAGLMGEALAVARDPAATLVRLVEDLEPSEVAQLRAALNAAAEREAGQ